MAKGKSSSREKVKKVIEQVREPLGLLETLKEEGIASATMLLGMASNMASGAAKNLKMEHIKPHLRELVQSLGFAFHADLEKLEARVEELEDRIASLEEKQLSDEE